MTSHYLRANVSVLLIKMACTGKVYSVCYEDCVGDYLTELNRCSVPPDSVTEYFVINNRLKKTPKPQELSLWQYFQLLLYRSYQIFCWSKWRWGAQWIPFGCWKVCRTTCPDAMYERAATRGMFSSVFSASSPAKRDSCPSAIVFNITCNLDYPLVAAVTNVLINADDIKDNRDGWQTGCRLSAPCAHRGHNCSLRVYSLTCI